MSFSVRNFLMLSAFFFGWSHSFAMPAAGSDSLLNGLKLELNAQYGTILPHHEGIKYVMGQNLSSFEIALSTESAGRHMWEGIYRFPRYGLAYNYKNFGNDSILGRAHAVFAFIDIPFHTSSHKLSASYAFNLGPALLSKKYSNDNNPLNLAISKTLDIYAGFDFNLHYRFNRFTEIKFGIELSHYSNGKVRTPNMGMNTLSFSGALLYSIVPSDASRIKSFNTFYSKHAIDLVCNFSYKRDDFLNEQLYMVNTCIADYYYSFTRKYSAGGGLDFFHDASVSVNRDYLDDGPSSESDNYQAGAHLAFAARYNRLNVLVNVGAYYYANYIRYTRVYTRMGIRYALSGRYLLNFTVKAHYAIADYVEWGIGYRFNLK